ncbi:MnhB domain-containing protein [Methylocaldum sp.]|uniref:MnhB domain-containing protein n=1 Tax=Methylocaldum sp. TaxID=1969727 RepID=UPI002D29D031|nr:MnhB domain-containing protein [Methylocaldum sp.]HYE35919.1 MnhB domain-containing protein [Methylocaldum sp.]
MSAVEPEEHGLIRPIAAALASALGIGLIVAIFALPRPVVGLAALVAAHLEESGVRHPVTAVLLNYRGYDTLLEIAVLLLAVLGVSAFRPAGPVATYRPRPDSGPVLAALIRLIIPLIVLTAGYLLWAGAHRPGGAFQAAAVLAGGGVLLRLTGLIPSFRSPPLWLRMALFLGFDVFLIVAALPLGEGSRLLEYRAARAGIAILVVESALTLSIAAILVTLFVGAAPSRIRNKRSTESARLPQNDRAGQP